MLLSSHARELIGRKGGKGEIGEIGSDERPASSFTASFAACRIKKLLMRLAVEETSGLPNPRKHGSTRANHTQEALNSFSGAESGRSPVAKVPEGTPQRSTPSEKKKHVLTLRVSAEKRMHTLPLARLPPDISA